MPTPLPPTLPSPPTGLLVIFSPGTFSWIADSLNLIYRAHYDQTTRLDLILTALGPLTASLENLMATVAELQTALDTLTATTDAATAAIASEIVDLKAAVDALAAAAPADLQPQVDQVNATIARLQTAADSLAADDAPAPPAEPV